MEQLLSKLGYDVRQTLHHITGLLELITEEPLSRNQSQYLSRCRTSADQLLRTANDLSFLLSDQVAPSPQSVVVVRDRVADIVELMSALATRKGLKLTSVVDSSTPELIAIDLELMDDSLWRILDNAIRYTQSGSVELSSHVAKDSAMRFVFEVSDTGPGIPADIQSDLESKKPWLRSGGLGLSVLRKRVAAAGGSLKIVSTGVSGTTLRVELPISPIPEEQPGHSVTKRTPLTKSALRLLIAEDSDDSFLLLNAYLKDTGHQVQRARNGSEAVSLAQQGNFDLILMDANMPVMNGYDATRTIREWETEKGRGRMPILLISADDRTEQLRLGAMVGCSGYVPKPTTKHAVMDALAYFTAETENCL